MTKPDPQKVGMHYWAARGAARLAATLFWRLDVWHANRVPASGPVILAANHASFADPPLVGAAALRPLRFLARSTLFEKWWFAGLIRSLRATPVDREGGGTGLKTALRALENGDALLLFPEGTRSPDGQLRPFRAGVGLVAARSKALVVPVRIFGAHDVWNRHRRWPRPGRVAVKFGRPFDPVGDADAQQVSVKAARPDYQAISDRIFDAIAALRPGRDVESFP